MSTAAVFLGFSRLTESQTALKFIVCPKGGSGALSTTRRSVDVYLIRHLNSTEQKQQRDLQQVPETGFELHEVWKLYQSSSPLTLSETSDQMLYRESEVMLLSLTANADSLSPLFLFS